MTIGDIAILLCIILIAYFVGRISMMRTIVNAVVNEAEAEKQTLTSDELSIEKINNIYYAYVGLDFAGQANNFDDLFENMKKDRRFASFRLTKLSNLSKEEQDSLLEAINKNYHQNEK